MISAFHLQSLGYRSFSHTQTENTNSLPTQQFSRSAYSRTPYSANSQFIPISKDSLDSQSQVLYQSRRTHTNEQDFAQPHLQSQAMQSSHRVPVHTVSVQNSSKMTHPESHGDHRSQSSPDPRDENDNRNMPREDFEWTPSTGLSAKYLTPTEIKVSGQM